MPYDPPADTRPVEGPRKISPDFDKELRTLSQEVLRQAGTSPSKALRLARLGAKQALERGLIWEHFRFLFHCLEQCDYLGRSREMAEFFDRALRVYQRLGPEEERGKYLAQIGTYYQIVGNFKEAYKALSEGVRYLEMVSGDDNSLGQALGSLGVIAEVAGDHRGAMEYYLRAIAVWEPIGNVYGVANYLIKIARINVTMSRMERAMESLDRAFKLHQGAGNRLGMACTLDEIARAYSECGKPQESLKILPQALEMFTEMGMNRSIAGVLQRLGEAHFRLGNIREGLSYCEQASEIIDPTDRWNGAFVAETALAIGAAYYRLGELVAARAAAERSVEFAESYDSRHQACEAHRLLSQILEELGDAVGALRHERQFARINKEIFGIERQKEFAEIELRQAIADVIREQQEQRRRAQEAEQEARRHEAEVRALALKSLHRDKALKRVQEAVRLHTNGSEDRKLAGNVISDIENALDEHGEWRTFDKEFESVHHAFIGRVEDRCSDLTPTEIRITILIRLGLANKQIGDALFIAPATVKTHRRNIRRKFGLSAGANLTSMLLSI